MSSNIHTYFSKSLETLTEKIRQEQVNPEKCLYQRELNSHDFSVQLIFMSDQYKIKSGIDKIGIQNKL